MPVKVPGRVVRSLFLRSRDERFSIPPKESGSELTWLYEKSIVLSCFKPLNGTVGLLENHSRLLLPTLRVVRLASLPKSGERVMEARLPTIVRVVRLILSPKPSGKDPRSLYDRIIEDIFNKPIEDGRFVRLLLLKSKEPVR